MKRGIIDVFVELGRRLATFCSCSETPESSVDAHRAVMSLAADMLSREALTDWLSHYSATKIQKNILIITAGNIPFVGMHDLLCVLAAGHRAMVRPSSRDAERMLWVISQLLDIDHDLPVSIIDDIDSIVADAIVAMGGDDTLRIFSEKFADLPVLFRGHRSSLAVLSGNETSAELLALSDDVLAYSGLGCRNVSLVFVPRGYDFSELQGALSKRTKELHQKRRNNYRQARAMFEMNGTPYLDCNSCLLTEQKDFSSSVSVLNFAFYDSILEVMNWMKNRDNDIQCIVAGSSLALPHPRAVEPGMAQHPTPFDYPDGRDTMDFLLNL